MNRPAVYHELTTIRLTAEPTWPPMAIAVVNIGAIDVALGDVLLATLGPRAAACRTVLQFAPPAHAPATAVATAAAVGAAGLPSSAGLREHAVSSKATIAGFAAATADQVRSRAALLIRIFNFLFCLCSTE